MAYCIEYFYLSREIQTPFELSANQILGRNNKAVVWSAAGPIFDLMSKIEPSIGLNLLQDYVLPSLPK